ncbi:protein FAM83F-like [Carassius auratus]|uniref:Protein FAM83F-like n=1 Tax=Carassius auratus TaxID=7957 RepID=A0A6P6P768_CARAU|nr:protein FAM83F-like [Carassius auratus]
MAESQLRCLEDGLMPPAVPESRPQFYYSEQHRAALERLITGGHGAFTSLLKHEDGQDFLSAREVKTITGTFVKYPSEEDDGAKRGSRNSSGSMRSTYWPQMSDTEVPPLDLGWPSSGLFKGVTRVSVYTHPPKENSPHIKEVTRKLIQESSKVVAIVMDLLTDLQILRDLFEASKRGVPVYIVLDEPGAPLFLDMCSRLQVGHRELKNIRTRTVKGIGLNLSVGRIPGNVQSKYMLIDGDKVMFGTYSFSWSSSRMDRNMITVMSGQVVDFYDNDFRELYAISDKLDLFKQFHMTKPQTGTLSRASVSKRPAVATSRFQVNLGDVTRGDGKVPAHKYHNPKYLLALGQIPGPTEPLQDFLNKMDPEPEPENPTADLENITPAPSPPEKKESKKLRKLTFNTKRWRKGKKDKTSDAVIEENAANPSDEASKHTLPSDETQDSLKKKKRGFRCLFTKS